MIQILKDYYEEVNEENKSYSDPAAHIRDKYCDPTSTYYRWDMTEEQRDIAFRNEMRMLKEGKTCGYNFSDYALKDYEDIYENPGVDSEEDNLYDRNVINQQISQILSENGITIPEGTNLIFSIDRYDFMLTVSGTDDKSLIAQIEDALNQGENTKNLFYHIWECMHDSTNEVINDQVDEDAVEKASVWQEIMNTTGYDLRELTCENGTFYTDTGEDLIELYRESSTDPSDVTEYYINYLKEYAKEGFNSTSDFVLSIGYNSNGLYDIGQENGYGYEQTDWLDSTQVNEALASGTRFDASV